MSILDTTDYLYYFRCGGHWEGWTRLGPPAGHLDRDPCRSSVWATNTPGSPHFPVEAVEDATASGFPARGSVLAPIIAGRSFLPGEDNAPSPSNLVVISERLWTERFNRDPATVGRTVRLDGRQTFTVVGVVSGMFLDGHSSRTEVWRTVSLSEYQDPRHRQFPYATLGRLAEGAFLELHWGTMAKAPGRGVATE